MSKITIYFGLLFLIITACSDSSKEPKIISSNNISDDEQVVVEEISYLSDGLNVKGYLAVPKADSLYPCVIFCRGGNREFGMITEESAEKSLGYIAKWGYVIIATQYRGVAGGEGKEEFGGEDVNDVLNLIDVLATIPKADTSRIGMYGFSRGGMMTYIALTKTDKIDAAVIHSGASDLFDSELRRPIMAQIHSELIPNYSTDREAELKARSAIHWVEKLNKNTPILLMHGGSDWRVHPQQAIDMADKLSELDHPFRFVFFENGSHSLRENREEVNSIAKGWLHRYVRDQNKVKEEFLGR